MSTEEPKEVPAPSLSAIVLRMATAYQMSQALYAATKLEIPDLLGASPRTSGELAEATGADRRALHRLLRSLVAFDVLEEREDGKFALGRLGSALRTDAPDSVRPLVLMFGSRNFWQTWGALLDCVKTGRTGISLLFGVESSLDYYAQNPDVAALFNDGMTAISARTVPAVVRAYDFSGLGKLVDVGGGHGKLLAGILNANPSLQGILFDLPKVVEGAAPLLKHAGVLERCEIVGGDMFDGVPPGGDAYVLSRVIHDWDDDAAAAVLRNCRQAVETGARLFLVERVLPDRIEASPFVQAQMLSDLNMLVRTGGRERTESEYRTLLAGSGFRLDRILATDAAVSIVEAIAL